MSGRGDTIDMPTTQNMLESLREELLAEIDRISGGDDPTGGGLGSLAPIAPWPVTVRKEKQKAVVGLKCTVPTGTARLKVVLEQYMHTSGLTVTVLRRFNGTVEVPDSLLGVGGAFSFDFPERLSYNAKYGCPKLVAILDESVGRIKNPATDLPGIDAVTTLNGAITAAATTIILVDGTAYSAGQKVIIEDELILLGVKSTHTFTGCARAQENTVAAAHASGVEVILAARLLADYLPGSLFTLGPAFPPPVGPSEILIREAGLDPATRSFDAYDLLRCFGPPTATGTGQSLRGAEVDSMQARVTELNEKTTLNGAITSTQTTITLTNATGFNQGDRVFITLANGTGELVLLGTKAVNTFTNCVRAQEGTPGTAFSNGFNVWRLTNVAHDSKDKKLVDSELDQTSTTPAGLTGAGYVDITVDGLAPGTPCVWIAVRAGASGEKSQSTGLALFFWAGDIARAEPTIPELTAFTFTLDQTPPNDGRRGEPTVNFTQPTPSAVRPTATAPTSLPVALERVKILRDGGIKKDKDKLDRDDLHTPGAKVVPLDSINTKKLTSQTFIARMVAFGGGSRDATLVTTTGDETGGDNAAPSNLPTPTFQYKRGKFICRLDMAGVLNVASLKLVELAIDNASISLNLADLNAVVGVGGASVFFDVGLDTQPKMPIERDLVKLIFGTSGILACKFRLTNAIGSTSSAYSNSLSLLTLKDVTTQYNPTNELRNGHFVMQNGTVAKRWDSYDPRTGGLGSLQASGDKCIFDIAEHRARWRDVPSVDNIRFLLQELGVVMFRTEYHALSWNIFSSGGSITVDEVTIGIYTLKDLSNAISGDASTGVTGSGFLTDGVKVGTVLGNGTQWRTVTAVGASAMTVDRVWGSAFGPVTGHVLIPQATRITQLNLALDTLDLFQKGNILTDSDLDVTLPIYFSVILREPSISTIFPCIDAICMNAGQESAGYQRSTEFFERNFADDSENFDSPPSAGFSSGPVQFPGAGSADPGIVQPILS